VDGEAFESLPSGSREEKKMRVNNGQGLQQQKVDSPLGFYSLELFQYPPLLLLYPCWWLDTAAFFSLRKSGVTLWRQF
jgi:hypothetical protein